MKNLRVISKNNWLVIIVGVIMAIYIMMPVVSNEECIQTVEQKQDASENPKEDPQVSELTTDAVQSSTQAQVERNSYLIETLPDAPDDTEEASFFTDFIPSPSKVFKVLFGNIISPNSP